MSLYPWVLIQSMSRRVVLIVGAHEKESVIGVGDFMGLVKPTRVATEAHQRFDPLGDKIP